jgi:hypothetical protein
MARKQAVPHNLPGRSHPGYEGEKVSYLRDRPPLLQGLSVALQQIPACSGNFVISGFDPAPPCCAARWQGVVRVCVAHLSCHRLPLEWQRLVALASLSCILLVVSGAVQDRGPEKGATVFLHKQPL